MRQGAGIYVEEVLEEQDTCVADVTKRIVFVRNGKRYRVWLDNKGTLQIMADSHVAVLPSTANLLSVDQIARSS